MHGMQSSATVALERPRRPLLTFGPFTFDPNSKLLRRGSTELAVPPRVLVVLELLLDRAGDVVPRQELIDTVWKDAFVTDTSLAEAVSVLRQALEDDPQSPTYIQTLHRRGYRFVAPVSSGTVAPKAEASTEALPTPEPPVVPSISGQLVPWGAATLCAFVAAAAIWQLTRDRADVPPAARFPVAPAAGTSFDRRAPALTLSPDGTQIAWSACDGTGCRLYSRPLDRLDPTPIAGTDDARAPFFSPDGTWIAFFADGRLKKVTVGGGVPVTLADAPNGLGGAWIDREIVFAGSLSGGLLRVSADGGEATPLTTPQEQDGEVRHTWPSLVPNRRVLLFTIESSMDEDALGALGALPLGRGGLTADNTPRWRTLLSGVGLTRALTPDTIVFSRGAELHAVSFDPARLATAGGPRAVVGGVATAEGRAQYALSNTGSLIYAVADPSGERGLFWWSPSGFRATAGEVQRLRQPTLAPDGTRVAGVTAEGTRSDIWVADVERGAATRLTHIGTNTSPVWSADGRTVYFASRSSGAYEIWRSDADGGKPATRLLGTARHAIPLAAAPDGSMLAFLQTDGATRADIWALPLAGGDPHPLVQSPFDDGAPAFSPDSRLLAYQSGETGRWEIYAQRMRNGRRTVVSTDSGEQPVWTKDGLYYLSRGRLMRAAISEDASGQLAVSSVVVTTLARGSLAGAAPDGRLLIDRGQDARSSAAVLNLQWTREVSALLGPPAALMPR
jgi:serine/threonine-protein kinase